MLINEFGQIETYLELEIELICQRLKKIVDQIEVLNWLNNFENEEVPTALTILKFVEYLNETDIIEGYKKCLEILYETIEADYKIIVHPIGDFGKSGSAMIYYFNKAIKTLDLSIKVEYISHHNKLKGLGTLISL